jgi:anhydro-N-acetylmuramic acid kinase
MVLWIGLISGTSADGVDAALVRIEDDLSRVELLAFRTEPIEQELRSRIHACAEGSVPLRELVRLHRDLGERFAEAARRVAGKAGTPLPEVHGIGSHGQTVAHFPEKGVGGTLQLGSPSIIHERTGIFVVADFRSGDLAAGGQGAPLTPFFHHAYFARENERRAVLNIGGFTNVTYLPGRDPEQIVAFDPGPGNALLDRAVRCGTQDEEPFDLGGARALRGRVVREVVEDLLGDPYFGSPPPKSTGHEHFGKEFFDRAQRGVTASGGSLDDLLATLAELTVESVVRAAERFLPGPVERWIVCGGGAHNAALLERLRRRIGPTPVDLTDQHGISVDTVEAITFAALGWASSRGLPGNVPSATGARRRVVLGSATPPNAFLPG